MSSSGTLNLVITLIVVLIFIVILLWILDRFLFMAAPIGYGEGQGVIQHVYADRDDKPKDGNNGQCRQLQKTFPEELQDFEGCHDTFTGKGHKDPEPLP